MSFVGSMQVWSQIIIWDESGQLSVSQRSWYATWYIEFWMHIWDGCTWLKYSWIQKCFDWLFVILLFWIVYDAKVVSSVYNVIIWWCMTAAENTIVLCGFVSVCHQCNWIHAIMCNSYLYIFMFVVYDAFMN